MSNEIRVCAGEMLAAEEAGESREGRGVRGFEDEVFAAVDVRTL